MVLGRIKTVRPSHIAHREIDDVGREKLVRLPSRMLILNCGNLFSANSREVSHEKSSAQKYSVSKAASNGSGHSTISLSNNR
jgi:hypothetical protein